MTNLLCVSEPEWKPLAAGWTFPTVVPSQHIQCPQCTPTFWRLSTGLWKTSMPMYLICSLFWVNLVCGGIAVHFRWFRIVHIGNNIGFLIWAQSFRAQIGTVKSVSSDSFINYKRRPWTFRQLTASRCNREQRMITQAELPLGPFDSFAMRDFLRHSRAHSRTDLYPSFTKRKNIQTSYPSFRVRLSNLGSASPTKSSCPLLRYKWQMQGASGFGPRQPCRTIFFKITHFCSSIKIFHHKASLCSWGHLPIKRPAMCHHFFVTPNHFRLKSGVFLLTKTQESQRRHICWGAIRVLFCARYLHSSMGVCVFPDQRTVPVTTK